MTLAALFFKIDLNFFFTAKYGFLKSKTDGSSYIGAPHRAVVLTAAASSSTENIAENITENIAHICAAEIKATEACSSSCAAFKGCMAELVILSSLFRIT